MKTKKQLQIDMDEQLVSEVTLILDELNLTPTSLITSLYQCIATDKQIPFAFKLSEFEFAKHQIQDLSSKGPVIRFDHPEAFEDWLQRE